jgi:protoporphyrinogen oxidase
MNVKKEIIVLGGGISGLTAARTIQDLGRECLMLEQCPSLGGLTRTVEVGEFCFDYTGHFLHLSRYKTPADIPYAGLSNDAWQTVDRRSYCFVAGKMIDAPIQYNLGQLPPGVFDECVRSYEGRPPLRNSEQITFRDYVIHGFGQYLADLFLIPQNEKTMAVSLDCLSSRAVKRFFPAPDETLVRAGIRGESAPGGYNSSFWYPKTGGIGTLVKGLSAGLNDIWTNQKVTALDLSARKMRTRSGESFGWDYLFSSMPLKSLCQITNDPDLRAAGQKLSHSSTVSFNIGLHGPLRPEFEGAHWIYIPDRSIPFYRVGFYSNISQGTCTPGHSAMYVEVGMPSEEVQTIDLVKDLQPKVIASLENLGWIDSRAVACVVIHVIRHAYIHHTESRDRLVESVLARLHQFEVYPFGRYGLWDYTSMEDSMESARSTVQEVVNGIQHRHPGPQRSRESGVLRRVLYPQSSAEYGQDGNPPSGERIDRRHAPGVLSAPAELSEADSSSFDQ